MAYSASFKDSMVQRMLGPHGLTATQLSQQTHLPQNTLSRWLREAGSPAPSIAPPPPASLPRMPPRSASDKLRLLVAFESVLEPDRGAWLRREGVLEAELSAWRAAMTAALDEAPLPSLPTARSARHRLRQLERELRRKDQALAEAAALLLLQKKVQALWGDEADATDPTSDD